jgi:hypothetical protein
MLEIAVQPPTQARPGVPLFPPVAARLNSETSIYEELSQMWTVATLIYRDGEVANEQLGGQTADSAHPMPAVPIASGSSHGSSSRGSRNSHGSSFPTSGNGRGSTSRGNGNGSRSATSNKERAYFYFPDLVIQQPGRYRIRITLMKMHYTNEYPDGIASVEEYVDSHSILVEEGASRHARPSMIFFRLKHIAD